MPEPITRDDSNRTPDPAEATLKPERAPTLREAVAAGLCVALAGSLLLAIVECLLVAAVVSRKLSGESIPVGLLAALVGRAGLTHALLWCPVMIAVALGHWGLMGRRPGATPIPFLAALFVFLAGVVVISVDLELAGRASRVLLIGGCAAAVILGAVKYVAARFLNRKLGRAALKRLAHTLTAVCLLVMVASSVVFVRSPLFSPATWRAPMSAAQHGQRTKLDVLWIVLDTARVDRMSCHGYPAPTTPFLDEWAGRALFCERAVANGMWTVPVHASMFTGLSVREHGTGHHNLWLDDSFRTVADLLAENGYATALFSNNPFVSPDTNLSKGFQTSRIVYHLRQLSRFSLDFLCEKLGITPFLPWLDQAYGAALANHLVAEWLDEHADEPKLVFINYMETHLPYRVPKAYRRLFLDSDQVDRSYDLRRRVHGNLVGRLDQDFNIRGSDFLSASDRAVIRGQYDAAIRYLDDRVREVIEMFKRRGMLDNTLVVIVSDHGEYLDTHGMWGHRFLTYQDLAHVTLQIREPQRREGVHLSMPVQLSDLYTTVLNAALPRAVREPPADSRDLLAVAQGGDERRIAICECNGPAPVTTKLFERHTNPVVLHRATPQIAAVGPRFKLIKSADGQRELYDLIGDPGELHNLFEELPDEAQRLDAHIRTWLEATPVYTPPRNGERLPSPEVLRSLRGLGYAGDDD